MICANALEGLLGFHGVNAAERIRAQHIYFVCFGYLVAELFEPNRRIYFAFRPQESCAFTAHNNPRLFCFCPFLGCFNDAANASEKSNRVRQTTHHHCRERFANIQRNISSFLYFVPNIQALFLQSLKKKGPVLLGN